MSFIVSYQSRRNRRAFLKDPANPRKLALFPTKREAWIASNGYSKPEVFNWDDDKNCLLIASQQHFTNPA